MSFRILVADDEPYVRDLVETILQIAGYEVILARDGAEALELARAERPDAVVLDIMMPRVDGRDVCRAIRDEPGLEDMLIVFFSSIDERDLERMGCADAVRTKRDFTALGPFLTGLLQSRTPRGRGDAEDKAPPAADG